MIISTELISYKLKNFIEFDLNNKDPKSNHFKDVINIIILN